MKASDLVRIIQEKISTHGDLPIACFSGEPLYQGLVDSVSYCDHTGMDGDLPNPHFIIDCK